ncbi:DnaB-like helicase N-terminal domain-containing protein [Actinotalea solisilvae]|uniref:DnaB-like helicase N-terminal domain-containing protein n=1 Tax=Actinotalea solisilvae TaxID=2072922 RepID=UPI0018F15573|nr:DnaB-like helicase N-terminal domain-containing protein [Actinotalea solisilvae]
MIRPDAAAELAERALLGSLLLDPEGLRAVRPWLRTADFTDPRHGQLYALLCERHVAGEATDPMAISSALVGRLAGPSPGVMVHDCLEAVPAVASPQTYARIVAEAGLRREIAGLGVLLRAGALQSWLSRESVPMASTCALVDAALVSVGRRWDAATGAPRSRQSTSPIQLNAALRNPNLRVGADKLLQAHPDRDVAAEHLHEALFVGSLITHPREVPAVGRHLRPQRFSSGPWRTVYGATLELAELGQPVDLVTVAHATARLSHHGQATPSLRELLEVTDAARHTAPRAAEQVVWVDQLRRIADNGADQLRKGAANPGLNLTDLVDTGRLITTALRDGAGMLPEHVGAETGLVARERAPQATRHGPAAG